MDKTLHRFHVHGPEQVPAIVYGRTLQHSASRKCLQGGTHPLFHPSDLILRPWAGQIRLLSSVVCPLGPLALHVCHGSAIISLHYEIKRVREMWRVRQDARSDV